jgi:hypothetical protein
MFNRKTLFIIGAGAGADVSLPVGRALALDIAKRTKVNVAHFGGRLEKGTADEDLALSFFEKANGKERDYFAAFELIRKGILLSNSIDDFLNIHEGSPEVVAVGKAAIVRSILHAESESDLFVSPTNANNTLDLQKIYKSWFVKFMQVLGPGRKAPDVERVLDDVSFINFNYDRCLEHFFMHALHLLYGIPKQEATDIVGRAPIIHPYGWVGPLDKVPFGGNQHGRHDYLELSKRIKTYTEQVEEEATVSSMQKAIREAECVVFLGFAYHKQNMRLLFQYHEPPTETKPVFATALGMSDADKEEVSDRLKGLFPEIDEEDDEKEPGFFGMTTPRLPALKMNYHIHIENKLNCAELFDYYAKSLSG